MKGLFHEEAQAEEWARDVAKKRKCEVEIGTIGFAGERTAFKLMFPNGDWQRLNGALPQVCAECQTHYAGPKPMPGERVSHGLCPKCLAAATAAIAG